MPMIEIDLIFCVWPEMTWFLVWKSIHPFLVWVVEIDVFFVWQVGIDLGVVCGPETT